MYACILSDVSSLCVAEDAFNEGIILPNLISHLRKILDQYPDDTQIFKVNLTTYIA